MSLYKTNTDIWRSGVLVPAGTELVPTKNELKYKRHAFDAVPAETVAEEKAPSEETSKEDEAGGPRPPRSLSRRRGGEPAGAVVAEVEADGDA
jgi:hypothetical protein